MAEHPALTPTVETDIKSEHGQRKWRMFWLKVTAFLLVVGLVVWFVFCRNVAPRISPETTYLTEPRLEKHRGIDYFKVIEQRLHTRPMDSDENGFRLLAKHLPLPKLPQEKQTAVYKQLGLSEKTTPDLRFEEPGTYLYNTLGTDWLKTEIMISQRPWTLEEYPFMQKWLEENEDALNLLNEVSRKPYFYVPVVKDEETSIFEETANEMDYHFHMFLRNYSRALHARANYHLGTGNIDAAIQDKLTIVRLGRYGGHGVGVIPGLIGIACEGIGVSIGIGSNLDALPNREQLQHLFDEYQSLPPRMSMETISEIERLKALDFVQNFYLHGFDTKVLESYFFAGTIPDWVNYVNLFGFDYNHVMREVNKSFDTGMADPFAPKRSDLFRLRGRSQQMANAVNQMMGGTSIAPAKEAWHRLECATNMQKIVLAMLLYHEDHGVLPPAFTVDENRQPLHSWRVLLLPYLGHNELYAKIRLAEPWDSEYNRQFHAESLAIYRCLSMTLTEGETSYTVIVGEKTAFNDSGTGRKLSDFGPKSGDMVLLGEMLTPICWMSPHDMSWERAKFSDDGDYPMRASEMLNRVTVHTGGSNFAFRNGSVRFASNTTDNEKWNGMLLGIQLESDDTVTLREMREQEQERKRQERLECEAQEERERMEAANKRFQEQQERKHLQLEQQRLKEQADRNNDGVDNEVDGFGDIFGGSDGNPFSEQPQVKPEPLPQEPPAKNAGRSLMRMLIPQKPKQESADDEFDNFDFGE